MLLAVAMALVHIVQTFVFILPSGQFKNLHLGLALLILILGFFEKSRTDKIGLRIWFSILLALAAVIVVYIHVEYQDLVNVRAFKASGWDLAIAVLLFFTALYVCGREWGWTIPLLALLSVVYGFYGKYIPGELFAHAGITLPRLISYTSIPFFQGLLGGLTGLSASTIFMFMLFAGVLKVTGGLDFIITLAYTIGGRSRAGPAQVAVVASGLMGMISGSTVANVAATGSVTIPMMKRYGFKGEFAGGVEAVASTGGQVTPPVMGLAAFLIVGITGIPYVEVMTAAAVPALIYYLYLMVSVHIQALKMGLDARTQSIPVDDETGMPANVTLAAALKEYGHLLLGIAILIYFLVINMPPGTAALYSILALLVLDAGKRLIVGRHTPVKAFVGVLKMVFQGLEAGARSGAQVAVVIGVMAILIDLLSVTGFAQKLSFLMLDLAGDNLSLLMGIAALTCLAFGLGLPTTASYILVALLGAPALVQLGVPLLAAHMFVFYFANVSAITPPVAIAALIASNIAKADFFKTALYSVRLGLPGFVLPFLFITHPQLLGLSGTFVQQLIFALSAFVAITLINLILEGYFLTRLRLWEKALLAVATTGLIHPGEVATVVGAGALLVVTMRQFLARRKPAVD